MNRSDAHTAYLQITSLDTFCVAGIIAGREVVGSRRRQWPTATLDGGMSVKATPYQEQYYSATVRPGYNNSVWLACRT